MSKNSAAFLAVSSCLQLQSLLYIFNVRRIVTGRVHTSGMVALGEAANGFGNWERWLIQSSLEEVEVGRFALFEPLVL